MKLFLDISRPMKNLLTLRVTKIRTDFQPPRKTLRQTTQSNRTLTALALILLVIPFDSTEGNFSDVFLYLYKCLCNTRWLYSFFFKIFS